MDLGHAAPTNDFVGGRELYNLVAAELKERLARTERLTLLPHNLSGVHVLPGRSPVFTMRGDDPSAGTNLEMAIETYAVDHGTFRLVQGAEVMGLSEKEAVLKTTPAGRGPRDSYCATVGGSGVRRWMLPARLEANIAVQTPTGWGFRTTSGIFVPDAFASFPTNHSRPVQDATVFTNFNEVVYVVNDQSLHSNDNEIVIAMQNDQGPLEQRLRFHQYGVQGLVRQQDGQWLAIQSRIHPLNDGESERQLDEALASVLQAAQEGDRAGFFWGLEKATRFRNDRLAGLGQLLVGLPNWEGEMQTIRRQTEWMQKQLIMVTNHPPSRAASSRSLDQLNEAAAVFRRDTKHFLEELDAFKSGPLGILPRQVASLIRQNYQYFDGQWIWSPHIAGQQSPDAAEVETVFLDQTLKPHKGIFRLDDSGHLTLLADCGEVPTPEHQILNPVPLDSPCMCFKSMDGQDLAFFPYYGLARMADGKLEWLDHSDEFKSMREVIGLDVEGRIYFRAGPYYTWHPSLNGTSREEDEDFWVYRLQGTPAAASRLRHLVPVTGLPVMDSSNQVWFLTRGYPSGDTNKSCGSLLDNPVTAPSAQLVRNAPDRRLKTRDWPLVGRNAFDFPRILWCYSNGQVFRCMTNLASTTSLIAGPTGGILGFARDWDSIGAFIFDAQGGVAGTSLHDLAQREFSQLMGMVPTQNQLPGILTPRNPMMHFTGLPAVWRLGPYLCVAHQGKLEAYRDGKPVQLGERLAQLCSKQESLSGLMVLGPVTWSNRPAAMLYFTGYRGNFPRVLWAVADVDTVELMPGEKPGAFFREADYRWTRAISAPIGNAPQDGFGREGNRDLWGIWRKHLGPVVDVAAGCIDFQQDAGQICAVSGPHQSQTLNDTGAPALATTAGELIVQCDASAYQGYRICAGENRRDIRATFSRHLRVLNESRDGSLLCCSPEGVTWLTRGADGDYVVSREIRLGLGDMIHSVVGETATELFLTVIDRTAQAYLAVVEK